MINLTPIINLAIALITALISAFAIPWLKSRTSAEQRTDLLMWVDIAVAAAQQLYHQSNGQTRLEYALSVLWAQGYDIDSVDVRNAVEAAVLKLHQQLEGDTHDS